MNQAVNTLISEVRAVGGRIAVNGNNLKLSAPVPLPFELVERIKKAKSDLIVALRSDAWTQDDWQYFYHERAGILQHDGKMLKEEAERIAFETCIVKWLNENPPSHADINTCPHCYQANNNNSIPVLKKGGHIWLHDKCHSAWLERRRQEAINALDKYAINN